MIPAALVPAVVATLKLALGYLAEHPDLTEKLVNGVIDAVKNFARHEPSIEQLTAAEAGLAAMRSNAVQEAFRRRGIKT